MKHGDKAKAKSAKAASKPSVKTNKASSAIKASSKAGPTSKSSKQQKATTTKSSKPAGGNGKPKADASGFSNPIVASAFKRAIKKFPTAFRRLTD